MKACYALREAPKLWEEARDKTLTAACTSTLIQQSYIYAFLQEMFDPECLRDRCTPGEPEDSLSVKNHELAHAQKARVKHPPLQAGRDPVEHTPILRLVGVLLCASLGTQPEPPDIAWAVARIASRSA